MVQRDLRLEDVFAADEMAVCASIGGVIPIASVDGRSIGQRQARPRHDRHASGP